jgi:hypothetical protein
MMPGLRLTIISFVAASLLATSAFAEERRPPPSPIFASPVDWGATGDPKAFVSLLFYARCAVDAERGLAAKFLRVDYTPKNWSGPSEDLVAGAGLCASDVAALKLTFPYLRGALIEALYDEDVLKDSGKQLIPLGGLAPGTAGAPPMLGDCVVNRKPVQGAAMLKTNIASADEAKVIAALRPTIDQCARERNVKSVYPEMLRFQIAEELYRRQLLAAGKKP